MIDTQDVYEAPVEVCSKGGQGKTNGTPPRRHDDHAAAAAAHGEIFALASWSATQPADAQGGKTEEAVLTWDSLRTRGDGSSSSRTRPHEVIGLLTGGQGMPRVH